MGIGKSVKGRLNLRSIEPEQPIDWADAVVWLRHGDSDSQPAIELPPEIAELDETARRDWERDWQVTTPEGRAFAAKQHFQMNQNFYAAVSDDGRFQIDGVPEGTYDLAVRGARVRDSEQPLPTYFSTTQIQVSHPHDKPVTVDHCDMVDYETWHDHLTQTHTTEEKSTSKFAIHRVIGHRSARPFGRGGEKMEPRPIRFGTMSPQDTRFDAMRPEKYPLDGIEYNPTPLISLDDITAYDWRAHKIYLKDGARDRLLRNIQPNVWGVPFVIVVDGSPAYLGAFWTTVSSYLANMPTICLDKWVLNSPEADGPHPPQDVLRIENSQVLSEGEEPSDRRDNVPLREALEEAGLLINAWSKTEPAE